jgi:hypothetical protein
VPWILKDYKDQVKIYSSQYNYKKVNKMKKRTLGMKILLAGSIATLVVACQPRNPRAPALTMNTQETVIPHVENEDIDLHVYGTNDTSTSSETEINLEPESVIADIRDVLENTIPEIRKIEEEVVVLDPVQSVEVTPEFQEN